jgi:repressor LexA
LSHAHRGVQLLIGSDGVEIESGNAPASAWRQREDPLRRLERGIPLVGRVAAGQPIIAVENIEGYVALNALKHDQDVFALRVKGDSMIEAGILDGDYILVRQQETAENGDIVVALLRDEATVKFFFREPKRIRLQPANRKMKPMYAKQVSIVGKVIASFRDYGSISLLSHGE